MSSKGRDGFGTDVYDHTLTMEQYYAREADPSLVVSPPISLSDVGQEEVPVGESKDAWQSMSACFGLQGAESIFFPPSHFERKADKLEREAKAKAICAACSVARHCLEYAIANQEPAGVWGGLNEKERGVVRVRRRA